MMLKDKNDKNRAVSFPSLSSLSDPVEYGLKHGVRVSYKLREKAVSSYNHNTEERLHLLLDADAETEEEIKKKIQLNKRRKKFPEVRPSAIRKSISQTPQTKKSPSYLESGEKEFRTLPNLSPTSDTTNEVQRLLLASEKNLDFGDEVYNPTQVFRRVRIETKRPSLDNNLEDKNIPKPRNALSHTVDENIKKKHDTMEAEINAEIKRNALATALKMDKRPGRWKQEFEEKMAVALSNRDAMVKKKEEDKIKANMAGLAVDFSWLHSSIKTDTEIRLKKWDDSNWQRNVHCEVCWASVAPGTNRVVCASCNVVCHSQCIGKKEGTMTKCGDSFFCKECLKEARKIERKRKEAMLNTIAKAQYKESALMLKYVMRLRTRIANKRNFKNTVIHFQSWIRGRSQRRIFRRSFSQLPRIYTVKILSVKGLQGIKGESRQGSSLGVILTVNSDESHLENIEDLSFSREKQLLRFDTDCFTQSTFKKSKGSCFQEKLFFVPGTSPHVQLAATVVSRDDLNLKLSFHGQAIFALYDHLFWNKTAELTLPLDRMEIGPRDQTANTPIWIGNFNDEGHGEITVELKPFSFYRAKCGYVEVMNNNNGLFRQKRWFCLVDYNLHIYNRISDPRPKYTMYLHGAQISLLEKLVINIKLPATTEAMHQNIQELSFIPTDPKEKLRWLNLLKRSVTLAKPARHAL